MHVKISKWRVWAAKSLVVFVCWALAVIMFVFSCQLVQWILSPIIPDLTYRDAMGIVAAGIIIVQAARGIGWLWNMSDMMVDEIDNIEEDFKNYQAALDRRHKDGTIVEQTDRE